MWCKSSFLSWLCSSVLHLTACRAENASREASTRILVRVRHLETSSSHSDRTSLDLMEHLGPPHVSAKSVPVLSPCPTSPPLLCFADRTKVCHIDGTLINGVFWRVLAAGLVLCIPLLLWPPSSRMRRPESDPSAPESHPWMSLEALRRIGKID